MAAMPWRNPIGVVVLCHGLTTGADDNGPFLPLRDVLLEAGFAVIRFDARCHGQTGGQWRDLSLAGWGDDICAVLSLAHGLGDLPVFILAASFAGGPALAAAERDRGVAGIVFWNAVLDYPRTFLAASTWAGSRILATAGDPDLPSWARYSIPWAGVALSDSLVEEMRADESRRRLARFPGPMLAFHGGRDRFVPLTIARAEADRVATLELRELAWAGHGFRGFRRRVRRESMSWLRARATEADELTARIGLDRTAGDVNSKRTARR